MKLVAVVLACSLALCHASSSNSLTISKMDGVENLSPRSRLVNNATMVPQTNSTVSLCNPCIQLSVEALNILLNEILNAGVVGGCAKLCGKLPGKDEALICNVVCDVVGIKAFIKAINSTDLDPIYFCEILKACPAGPDDASANITAVASAPTTGPAGTKFNLELSFDVQNATGVGEIVINVDGPVTSPVGQGFVNTGFEAGPHNIAVSLDTQDDPSSDPPVEWNPGQYTFTFVLCQGECFSKHPHSITFGQKSGTFTITES